ncbi:glycosyltransferase family 1 protein [Bacillus sp. ISL-18]|uniref:glycosyltransferase family 1 protein n=1 Tax=Bacillus sp. ISL-18 TaxID=2819118 RepID=UPI001BE755DB|nr:glycosyltransferase family 1 protein [Bacillus sp. ISL-18]MBT2657080.1 glycosyltransferase family 1 protein [Bacillus sp. ISL-18]
MGGPLRILHVVVNMNRGGAETLIMNLYRNMDRSKVQFDFLTSKEGVFDKEIIELGGIIHRIPYINNVGHFKYLENLFNFFSSNKQYSIVHSHMDKMSGLILKTAKKAGIQFRISHSHNTNSEGGLLAKCYKWYAGGFIEKCATDLIACSSEASKWLFGRRTGDALILKNGIDYEKFKYSPIVSNNIRQELNLNNNELLVGHVGRFCHQKNHEFLLEIFSEIIKIRPNSYLLLVGEGPLKKSMEEKAEKNGLLNKVKFLGLRSDINHLVQAFDLMIFPSFHEGLPVTLIEAQGAGLPCLVSDSITKEVDIGAGLISYKNLNDSPKKWADEAICLRKGLKDNSRFLIEKGFDITQSAAWIQDYYTNLISTKQKSLTIFQSVSL